MPTIEVLLPIKNALPYLPEAIDSVFAQTFQDWRLSILDHGSTDGSLEIAQRYAEKDRRVHVASNPGARGLAGLLNFGLERADARLVLRQDGDDISRPDRFQVVVDTFDRQSDLLVLGAEATVIDKSGQEIGYMRLPGTPAAVASASFFYNPIAHPTAAIDLLKLRRYGGWYGIDMLRVLPTDQSLEVLSLAEDYFFFGQLAQLGSCANIKRPLIKYRYHSQSESVLKRDAQNACAVSISRFLAASFAALKGVELFDPAPFCSHAENIFDCGLSDYSAEFNRMARSLREGLCWSPELARELAFRCVLANRNSIVMFARYFNFALAHGLHSGEWRVVRNWIGRLVDSKHITRVDERISRLPQF
ncbi:MULTISPECIES: glycosyltransferase family 2 protein [unclassified Bradyrhizobium]|uniref:glycosyltransferase family 2 protein n=1 Tax=unclassified Bradyrhizobium TaxID=2631580 RepID=UPI001CD3213D|nr:MULTISPECIES: glycosyltransferase family 2 protein [unclassified Bradyrhizobium]MCA1495215.1 glycosyltransferase family 2 protein [Bradyrhizobium sp. NBAIM14]MCA1531023.1 glycosyltransferase family 2 protein [Bradyrhizobium sp. NBAIM03]